jgi:hypothetical protein
MPVLHAIMAEAFTPTQRFSALGEGKLGGTGTRSG